MADVKTPDETTLPIKRTPESLSNDPKKPKTTQNDVVQSQEPTQEEQSNGEDVIIDRKGKGILIEEEGVDDDGDVGIDLDDSDSDSESDSDSDSDSGIGDCLSDDTDFNDDPLAEVDLENILPSRTRRKSVHPGLHIGTIPEADAEEDDDESDDPDA